MAYSRLERVFHAMAFNSSVLQAVLEDLEKALFSKKWRSVIVEKPVFVTALPRAGTTITLEVLSRIPGVATHTYRDMPFLLTPYLWERCSKILRNQARHRERAHGDGLVISEDSPEAFEEVVWHRYFPDKYGISHIECWYEEDCSAFQDYFVDHVKKIISLRVGGSGRYASKNNANIARAGSIISCFPDAVILTPVRSPVEHAVSLWTQHLGFLKRHEEDGFSKKYMADIGHYEFGALHRPILFPRFKELTSGLLPDMPDYWLAYWVAAYDYLLNEGKVKFFLYEELCNGKRESVAKLLDLIDLPYKDVDLAAAASLLRPPSENREGCRFNRGLAEQADELYEKLKESAVSLV